MTIERFQQNPTMHRAVAHGDTLYVSGIFAGDLALGMEGQTLDALGRIAEVLAAHGSGKDRVLASTVYVTDLSRKEEMNSGWKSFFPPEALPTRATVEVSDLGPGVLVEIAVIAARG